MFFNFKKNNPILDQESITWMFETFSWALDNFGVEAFNASRLVNPSNEHFPGRANSVDEMAKLIFERVVVYAGMAHWPFQLTDQESLAAVPAPIISVGLLRSYDNQATLSLSDSNASNACIVNYHPQQINDPQVLIGSYAHALAHYLATQAKQPPPGGQENWPHVTELLAVFLGFGIIMANSAYTNKVRSCGSCAGPLVERTNFLSQYDITYALAIFTASKNIPNAQVIPHLKKSLHSYYKKALKDIEQNQQQFSTFLA